MTTTTMAISAYIDELCNRYAYDSVIDYMYQCDDLNVDTLIGLTYYLAESEGIQLIVTPSDNLELTFEEIYRIAEKGLS